MNIDLTDDEFALLTDIFNEHGSDCSGVDSGKMRALAEKLGIWESIPPPTAEEKERWEKFRNSELGQLTQKLFARVNEQLANQMIENFHYYNDSDWNKPGAKIGTSLKIRLPKDYTIKE